MINRNLYQKGKIISIPNELYLDEAKRLEYIKSEALYKNAPDTVIEYVVMKRFEDLSQ